jgi:small subunit ribosomal protein S16
LAVKIRLKKMGSKKRPFYRFVAADTRSPRDGRFIEILGYYNPLTDPPELKFDEDKVYKWLDDGAKPTPNAEQLMRKAGLIERWRLLKAGVAISELDAKIEERRAKQPQPQPKGGKAKLSKKGVAAEGEGEEEKLPEAPRTDEAEAGSDETGAPDEAGRKRGKDKSGTTEAGEAEDSEEAESEAGAEDKEDS